MQCLCSDLKFKSPIKIVQERAAFTSRSVTFVVHGAMLHLDKDGELMAQYFISSHLT